MDIDALDEAFDKGYTQGAEDQGAMDRVRIEALEDEIARLRGELNNS